MRFLNWAKGGKGPKPNGDGIRYDNATPNSTPTARTTRTSSQAGPFLFGCLVSVLNSLSPLSLS